MAHIIRPADDAALLQQPPAAEPGSPAPDVFEGPEKKLEIFFHAAPANARGFRSFEGPVWSDVLLDARCTILHREANESFDAYLLSESSLFVYPNKLILKTCGTTTLLLVLPKVLALAAKLGCALADVHYSHFRYAFPKLQPYPHSSFDEEQRTLEQLLHGHVGAVRAATLANSPPIAAGSCWYALCAEAPEAPWPAAAAAEEGETPIFEVAMEGLPARLRDCFFGDHPMHAGAEGKALAASMTDRCGLREVLALGESCGSGGEGGGAAAMVVDDWAFEPCGYSMNALRGDYYYTVHVTPESGYSYASFETNDPAYASAEGVRRVAAAFMPETLTVTLTTRAPRRRRPPRRRRRRRRRRADLFPVRSLDGYACAASEVRHLSPRVTVSCAAFAQNAAACQNAGARASAAVAEKAASEAASDEAASDSWADSESTAPLDDSASDKGSDGGWRAEPEAPLEASAEKACAPSPASAKGGPYKRARLEVA